MGRFISQDPLWFKAGDLNLYRYVSNSPLLATDPSGLVTAVGYGTTSKRSAGGTLAAVALRSPSITRQLVSPSSIGNIYVVGSSKAGIILVAAQGMLMFGTFAIVLLLENLGMLSPAPIVAARINVKFGEVEGRVSREWEDYCREKLDDCLDNPWRKRDGKWVRIDCDQAYRYCMANRGEWPDYAK